MKATLCGALGATVIIALVWLMTGRDSVFAQRLPGVGVEPSGELIALTSPVDNNHQQLTVIDPRTRVLGVYQLELGTGAVTLKSVRNLSWDLQMDEFNGVKPLPREIRSLLERR